MNSPDLNVFKVFIKTNPLSKIKLDIICNEFEYEILYKRSYPMNGLLYQG